MIRETIVTTVDAGGTPHIAPMGVTVRPDGMVLAPFRPSTTLDNLLATGCAVINYSDDARVFAGCLTGRRDWPLVPATAIPGLRLAGALAHAEVRVASVTDDDVRPSFLCRPVFEGTHRPFTGFNRAAAAVVETAILVSRLDRLPRDKIDREVAYLTIAIDKTAGPREREAWGWLMDRIETHRRTATVTDGTPAMVTDGTPTGEPAA